MHYTNKPVTNIKVLQRLLCIFSLKTLQCCLFSAPPTSTCVWCKLLYKIASPSTPHCVTACASSELRSGNRGVVANIISRGRGHAEVCCGWSPWRGPTPFPRWLPCLSCNPRQRGGSEQTRVQPRISTKDPPPTTHLRLDVSYTKGLRAKIVFALPWKTWPQLWKYVKG